MIPLPIRTFKSWAPVLHIDTFIRWEPEENVAPSCERLLTSFWEEVGTDNRDYPIGYLAKPSAAWIGTVSFLLYTWRFIEIY